MATTVRAAISATPVIGALKKFRPRTSATISIMSAPMERVPTDDMMAAVPPSIAPKGASEKAGT